MVKSRKYLLFILGVSLLLAFGLAGTAGAKSLYVIADINAYQNIPIQAYDIQGTNLVYQWTGYIPDRDGGAVGLTIDTDSEYLFVTFEFSGVLDMVDAKTMTRVGQVTAPGASNLAGIVVDQGKKKVYCVDRRSSRLYVYLWDSSVPSLTLEGGTYKTLSNATAWGIALDETTGLLYVANGNNTIRYYDTTSWAEQGSFTVTPRSIGIAVDTVNKYVYSGYWYDTTLSKYDLNTSTETTITTNSAPIGFAVDQATGLLYVTYYSYDRLRVFDSDLNAYWTSGDLGNPTGVCVPILGGFNPLNLTKNDNPDPVTPGGQITYTICFDNLNNPDVAVDDVEITDDIPNDTTLVSYQVISEPPGGTTISDDGTTVTWDVGTVAGGAGPYCMEMVVQVDPNFGGDVITNDAYIYWSIGGQPSSTHATEETDVVTTICGDFDGDLDVDLDDYNTFVSCFGSSPGDPNWNAEADFDGDGLVALPDFAAWYQCYMAYISGLNG